MTKTAFQGSLLGFGVLIFMILSESVVYAQYVRGAARLEGPYSENVKLDYDPSGFSKLYIVQNVNTLCTVFRGTTYVGIKTLNGESTSTSIDVQSVINGAEIRCSEQGRNTRALPVIRVGLAPVRGRLTVRYKNYASTVRDGVYTINGEIRVTDDEKIAIEAESWNAQQCFVSIDSHDFKLGQLLSLDKRSMNTTYGPVGPGSHKIYLVCSPPGSSNGVTYAINVRR